MDIERKKNFIVKFLFYAIVILVSYFVFKYMLRFLLPFIISFILVYSLQKPSCLIAKRFNLKQKTVSVILVLLFYVLIFTLVFLLLFLMIRRFERNSVITSLISLASDATENLFSMFGKFVKHLPESAVAYFNSFAEELPTKFGGFLTNGASRVVSGMVSSVPELLFSLIITVVSSCYFANEYEPLKNFFLSVLPSSRVNFIISVKKVINENVIKIIKGYFLISAIVFSACSLGFLFLGQKNAVLIAAAVTIVDILPVLGVGTVLIPWCVIEFIKGNIFFGAGLIIIYLCSLGIHHILEPRFVGKNVGIPPFISLVFMFVLLKLFGFFGMITALLTIIVIINLYKDGIIG